MKNEFYNLGQPSKNLLERDKRLQASKLEYLKQYDQNLKEATELKEAEELNAAMSAARFSYASTYARSKNRVNKLNEEIQYNENASLVGMTEMIANVVENALLLDEEEYSAINPEYKEQMRDTIFGLLKEAEINDVITNKDTLAIMEYVARKTPTAREGVNLTEDELSNYIVANRPENIDESIRNLSRSVSGKVAQLMEKEQAKVDKINSDVKKAKAPKENKEKEDKLTVEDILAALDAGELVEDDVDEMLANGEISQEVYDEVVETVNGQEEEIPMEEPVEEEAPVEEMPNDNEEMPEEGMEMGGNPKKQIQLSPDGTISVNIFESDLIRETPRCGLLESLAVNEAQNMLARGEEYNPDLALANTVMYVTITETMNEMGLLNVDDQAYSHIISAAGGNINEARGYIKRYANGKAKPSDMKHTTDADFEDRYRAYEHGKKAAKGFARAASTHNSGDELSGKNIASNAAHQTRLGKSYKHNAKSTEEAIQRAYARTNSSEGDVADKHVEQGDQRKAEKKGLFKKKNLTEAAVTQWGVQMNTSNSDDFAERIRQKKLLKENNQTLHD